MKALIKYSLITLLLLILLLIAAVVTIPMLVNPNDYKPELEQLVYEHSGLQMEISGEIKLSVFPWLGFEVAGISLTNQHQPLATLASARAGLKITPLLIGNVEMNALEINGVELQLRKDAEGHANWQLPNQQTGLSQTPTKPTATTSPVEATSSSESGDNAAPAINFNIAKIKMRDISINYRDQQQGSEYQLDNMHLTTGAIAPGQPFDLDLEFTASSNAPKATLDSRLSTRVTLNLEDQHYLLENLDLQTSISGQATGEKTIQVQLQTDLSADLANDQLTLDNLMFALADLKLTGKLQIDSLQQPQYQGQLDILAFDLNALLEAIGQTAIETSNPQALSAIGFSGQFNGTDQNLNLDRLNIDLDNSHFQGKLEVVSFARQALRFELQGDRLNVDDYLPPANETSKQQNSNTDSKPTPASPSKAAGKSNASPWDKSPLLPVESLKALDIVGQLQLQEIIVSKVSITNPRVKFSAQKGLIKLQQFKGQAFKGDFSKTATINLNKKPLTINSTVNLQGIDITEVLKAASPEQPIARGNANITSKISARGNSLHSIVNSLNGTTDFTINEGALLNTNLNHMVCSAVAKVRKKTLATSPQSNDTPFNKLSGTLNIRKGLTVNKDLTASMDNLKLAGDGEINLPRKHLDYHLGLTIIGNSEDQDEACQINEQYADIAWPVRCKGPFDSQQNLCGIDGERMGSIIARLAGSELEKKINDKLEEKFGTSLKGLLDKFK